MILILAVSKNILLPRDWLLTHPALQLGGELALKLAGGALAVVPLDEDLVGQRCAVPQLLQVVELWDEHNAHARLIQVGERASIYSRCARAGSQAG